MVLLTPERKRSIKALARTGDGYYRRAAKVAAVVRGRVLEVAPLSLSFRGAYDSHEAAMAAVPADKLPGYNHEEIAEVSFEQMCRLAPWDYPVLYWLNRLFELDCRRVLDAGGHMGTKYRAFSGYLAGRDASMAWTIYDLPEIVKAGRRQAELDRLDELRFVDDLRDSGPVDVLLASGLLQYLDIPFGTLIGRMREKPAWILINKLAVREGRTVVTLENFGKALVPYRIRCRSDFFKEIDALGYAIEDSWENPTLSHVIPTHPELGASTSIGLCLRLA